MDFTKDFIMYMSAKCEYDYPMLKSFPESDSKPLLNIHADKCSA